ncbi:MAG: ribose-5-phosphate isomerase RpiA [Parvularculaceae bacterium]
MTADEMKRRAGVAAMEFIEDGMLVGLGTGSTAAYFVRALGEAVAGGLNVRGVATSRATEALAADAGVPVLAPEALDPARDRIAVVVDGADECDRDLRLIKGGGGALLREKIIAYAADKMIVIADEGKLVETLGAFALPVEVVRFGWNLTQAAVSRALDESGVGGAELVLRMADNSPFVSDGGNYILDCACGRIEDPERLAAALSAIPGVVEHGLFIGLADLALLGTPDGVKRIGPV